MSQETVACRYPFTTAEFKRAARCYYRYSTGIWWMAGCMILIAIVALLQDVGVIWTTPGKPLSTFDIVNNLLSFVFFAGLMALIFVFANSWSFRRMPSYNQDMRYELSAGGIHLKTALFEITVFWEAVARAAENKNGIVLFLKGKRSFHWLPKSGFADSGAVDACRILLRQHVPDTKKLFAVGSQAGA